TIWSGLISVHSRRSLSSRPNKRLASEWSEQTVSGYGTRSQHGKPNQLQALSHWTTKNTSDGICNGMTSELEETINIIQTTFYWRFTLPTRPSSSRSLCSRLGF